MDKSGDKRDNVLNKQELTKWIQSELAAMGPLEAHSYMKKVLEEINKGTFDEAVTSHDETGYKHDGYYGKGIISELEAMEQPKKSASEDGFNRFKYSQYSHAVNVEQPKKSAYSYIGFVQCCLRSGEKWDGTYDDFVKMNEERDRKS